MERLMKFRSELDELDQQLVDVLARRFSVCRQVAEYKAAEGIPMMQPARVAEVKRRAVSRALPAGLSERFTLELYDLIIGEACRMEDDIIGELSAEPAETNVA
jgi:chorismate mutase-like protein